MPTLYPYQEQAVRHALQYPRCGLFMEPGLGKTATAINTMRQREGATLVVAPKRVIDHTWPTELKTWWPEARVQTLALPKAKRPIAYDTPADVYLINFEILAKCFGTSKVKGEFKWKYPNLVIDESSKIKNRATGIFKTLRFNGAKFQTLMELTGTPAPRSMEDLWAQVYLMDRGERLGRTLTAFRQRWFVQGKEHWQRYISKAGAAEINRRISDICLSMKAEDYLQLPDMVVQDIIVDLPDHARRAYETLQEDLVVQVQGHDISAPTAANLMNKLLQMTGGTIYSDEGVVLAQNTAKKEALQDLIEELGDEPLLVVYGYKPELEWLRELGAVELRDSKDTVDRWNAGKIKLFAIHPASGGIGLNLQAGGGHLCWTTPTFNLEHYIQTNKRLHRNGQTRPVFVHRLIAKNTVDQTVYDGLFHKTQVQDILMDALQVFEW
jgi:SNF2 family DNA or RNA helicase